ncbi:hypothetical protein LCGC14_2959330, partial [marine sediment metagenome]
QDVFVSCTLHSIEDGRRFAGKSVGKRNRLWSCGIHNGTPARVELGEAIILMALRGLAVPAISSSVLRTIVERERYRGRLYTAARVLEDGSQLGVLGMAIEIIKVGPVISGIFAAVSIALPVISPRLRARAPSSSDLAAIVAVPVDLAPGGAIMVSVWSSSYDGPKIVQGALSKLVAPTPQFSGADLDVPVDLPWDLWNFPTMERVAVLDRIMDDLRRPKASFHAPSRPVPEPARCSHVIEADCSGRCEGWWLSAALVGLHR